MRTINAALMIAVLVTVGCIIDVRTERMQTAKINDFTESAVLVDGKEIAPTATWLPPRVVALMRVLVVASRADSADASDRVLMLAPRWPHPLLAAP